MENSNVKAKYVYYCDERLDDDEEDKYDCLEDKYENIKNISELSHIVKDYNYGDLVAFSDYRDTGTYIIGKGGKLVSNEDNSGSGYLSIPYEITQYLDNAVEMYCHSGLSVNDIEIRFDDKYILENVNTEKCKILEKWNWKISYCHDMLWIEFPNGKGQEFAIDEKAEDILSWYQSSGLEQVKFKVFIELSNSDYDKYKKKYGEKDYKWLYAKPELPSTWKMQTGSGGGSSTSNHSNLYFYGPSDYKTQVFNNINKFYEGFNYELSEV